ncbi:MAG: ankyrin repeat domain-containing protein [Candidatus Babeliaceae bacterium]|jgi:hypothetical protein
MNKKTIFILLIIIFWAHPIPVSFERLILVDAKGKLQKTVDLIGDAHLAVRESVRRPSRGKKELLLTHNVEGTEVIEQKLFTTAERTLLIALRTLHKRSEKIDILWEALPRDLVIQLKINVPFLFYSGFIAEKKFGMNNKGGLKFINADSYRRTFGPNGIYVDMIPTFITQPGKIDPDILQKYTFSMVDFKNCLEKVIEAFSQKSAQIQKKSPEIYAHIEPYWTNLKNIWQKEIIEEMIDPALIKNKDINIPEFLASLTFEQIDIFFSNVLHQIINTEILFQIIGSDTEHVIAYTGAAHSIVVRNILLQHFGYQTEIAINVVDPTMKYLFPLSHRAWQFLLESPQASFQKYKHRKRPLLFNETEREQQFYTIIEKMNDVSLEQEAAQSAFIKEQLEPFFKKSDKSYINFLETHTADTFETLLFSAVKNNLPNIVEYLIRKGARVNTANIYGGTPVHYASATLPSPRIFTFLLKNGGDITIQDNAGRTPIDIVNEEWKAQLDKLLKTKTEKSSRTLVHSLQQLENNLTMLYNYLI